MAKVYSYEFTVSGSYPFPLDMLRYDRCWPKSQDDVSSMMANSRHTIGGQSKVTMVGLRRPTIDRWSSFGWKLVSVPRKSELLT
jgi:hypothetical protein